MLVSLVVESVPVDDVVLVVVVVVGDVVMRLVHDRQVVEVDNVDVDSVDVESVDVDVEVVVVGEVVTAVNVVVGARITLRVVLSVSVVGADVLVESELIAVVPLRGLGTVGGIDPSRPMTLDCGTRIGTIGMDGSVPVDTGTVIGARPATGAGVIVSVVPGPIDGFVPGVGGSATSFSEKCLSVISLPLVTPCTASFESAT